MHVNIKIGRVKCFKRVNTIEKLIFAPLKEIKVNLGKLILRTCRSQVHFKR